MSEGVVDDEPTPRAAPRSPSLGGGLRALDRRVLVLWHVEAALWWALAAVVAGLLAALLAPDDGAGWTVALLVAFLAGGLGVALALPRLRHRTWRYEVGDEGLVLEHGVVFRSSSVTPYRRIQLVDIASGPLERALGLGHLVLHTASATTDAEVPGIPLEEADELRTVILGRAGVGDAV